MLEKIMQTLDNPIIEIEHSEEGWTYITVESGFHGKPIEIEFNPDGDLTGMWCK